MSSFAFETAETLVNDAAVEVGLSASSDVWGSTDPNFVQLRGLLKSLGRELWRKKQWTWLQQVYTFVTVQGESRYDLPADFGYMLEQTGWNRSSLMPLGGPLSPQQWEYLKAWTLAGVVNVLFRPVNRQLWLQPSANTPGDLAIAFEYLSRYWVVPTGTRANDGPWTDGASVVPDIVFTNAGNTYVATSTGTTGSAGPTGTGTGISDGGVTWDYVSAWGAEAPAANDDVIQYEPLLVVRGLKLAFLKAKGLDTTAAQADFDAALDSSSDADSNAPVLQLSDADNEAYLLGWKNIPDTGYDL